VISPNVTTLGDLLGPLTEELPQVIAEVVNLLREEWPDYAAFLAEDPTTVLETAQVAIEHLVALAERGPAQPETRGTGPLQGGGELFEEVGRVEWREGRSLATLLSAYRAGARVAWRHMSRAALRRGAPPEAIALLAEAVFVFVEDLSSASARGYVEEQLATAAERERLRADLAELLLSERADLAAVRATAAAAGWPLPATAALVVVPAARGHDLFARLEPSALPLRRAEMTGAIVADPDGPGRRTRLAAALAGLGAVVGSSVTTAALPSTLRAAAVAARLRHDGVLVADPVFVDEHYDALVVHDDPALLEALTAQVLAPLAVVPAGTRARLEETLTVWLSSMGDRQEVARRLHVHPQTVRYRMGRLHALYGETLDDPRTRVRLMLALCWR
jgi:DNA-binding PucR family transcriptional regulator